MRIDDCRGVTSRSTPAIAGLIAGVCACMFGFGGCSSDAPKGSATLDAGEFRSGEENVPPPAAPVALKSATVSEAAAGFLDLTSLPGPPSTMAPAVTLTGDEVIVDQFIGQVNGRAMMASEFFGDGFGERLRAMGRDEKYAKQPNAWRQEAGRLIYQRLMTKVKDGLLLDEVYSAMSPEVKHQGLRHFLDQMRGEIVRSNQGSAALADERLREKEGKTIDEVLKDRRDLALTYSLLQTKVDARVNVSWQQVVNEYERRNKDLKDQRLAKFLLVIVPTRDAEAVARVKAELERGVALADLTSAKPSRMEVVSKGSPLKVTDFADPINKAVEGMSPGQTVGPITLPNSLCWVSLEAIIEPEIQSLFDAQLEIERELKAKGRAKAEELYVQGLMDKSSRTPLNQMIERLFAIAVERYAPRGNP